MAKAKGKRECGGTNAEGGPCGAHPLKPGTVIDGVTVSGRWCRQHDEDLPDSARIGGAQEGAGRPKKPRVVDVLKERIEAEVDQWLDVLQDARVAVKVVGIVGEGEMAEPVEVEDHAVRLKALSIALDRVYGRPRQEITGADGQPLQLEVTGAAILSDPDARKHAAGLRKRVGASRAQQPSRSRASH